MMQTPTLLGPCTWNYNGLTQASPPREKTVPISCRRSVPPDYKHAQVSSCSVISNRPK
jgi:hypothetical protein